MSYWHPIAAGSPALDVKWNDQISGDWGGQAMQDILSSTDAMLAEDFIDKKHVAAVGASFGGYTVYWLMGQHQDRFACMIAHCGVFNLESMYGSTEELFFVNWDLGGPYWTSPEAQQDYNRFSPHRFVKDWETPLLVIHGQKDFRVPVTQGIEAFTAAQDRESPFEVSVLSRGGTLGAGSAKRSPLASDLFRLAAAILQRA